jgi:hypothetical protein
VDHASNPVNHPRDLKPARTHSVSTNSYPTFLAVRNKVMDKKLLPIEIVSRMLGHRRIATSQHFANIVDKRVEEDMRVLVGKLRFGGVPQVHE